MAISNFFPGTTFSLRITINLNGTNPDITADTITFTLKVSDKDIDADAVIQQNADVATEGVDGIATLTLTPATTDVPPRTYHYDLQWIVSTGEEYILDSGTVKILERVSDP
jgi:hypothetical protein